MSTPRRITDRQRQVLAFVISEVNRCGTPPSLREIGVQVGITSTNGVAQHINALRRQGHLTVEPIVDRGIRVTELGRAEFPGAFVLVASDGHPAISAPAFASFRSFNPLPCLEGSTT